MSYEKETLFDTYVPNVDCVHKLTLLNTFFAQNMCSCINSKI